MKRLLWVGMFLALTVPTWAQTQPRIANVQIEQVTGTTTKDPVYIGNMLNLALRWTTDASVGAIRTKVKNLYGLLYRVAFIPEDASDQYDLYFLDVDGFDLLEGAGEDLNVATPSWIQITNPIAVTGTHWL